MSLEKREKQALRSTKIVFSNNNILDIFLNEAKEAKSSV